jgi:hypothetical protein
MTLSLFPKEKPLGIAHTKKLFISPRDAGGVGVFAKISKYPLYDSIHMRFIIKSEPKRVLRVSLSILEFSFSNTFDLTH